MYGISFNGKHSYKDMNFTMPFEGRRIGFPSKNKVLIQPPHSNIELDFSEIYGSQTYSPRPLTYVFNLYRNGNWTHQELEVQKTKLVNWLMNSNGKKKLYDDDIPGYYFLAEVESEADFQDDFEAGTLTVYFKAYPFMISELPEGHDIWDNFNFELDVAQPINYTVNGQKIITLVNAGTPDVSPEITVDSVMKIDKGNFSFELSPGVNKNLGFVLNPGENKLVVNGKGSILFEFYKELI